MRTLEAFEIELVSGGDDIRAGQYTLHNATAADLASFQNAMGYLEGSNSASATIRDNTVTDIYISHDGNIADSYKDNSITWDPNGALGIKDNSGNVTGAESSALALLHEFNHNTDPNYANDQYHYFPNDPNAAYQTPAEKYAIDQTNQAAQELGEPTRSNADGTNINVNDQTEHTTTGNDGSQHWSTTDSDGQSHSGPAFNPNGQAPDMSGDSGDNNGDGNNSGDGDSGDNSSDGDSGDNSGDGDSGDNGGDGDGENNYGDDGWNHEGEYLQPD